MIRPGRIAASYFGACIAKYCLRAGIRLFPAVFFIVAAHPLTGSVAANAQSYRPHSKAISAGARQKRGRGKQRYRVRSPKKTLFPGTLFASNPRRRRAKPVKPLFGSFSLKLPTISPSRNPAALRASYEHRMRAGARRPVRSAIPLARPRIAGGQRRSREMVRRIDHGNRPRGAVRPGSGKYRTMCVRLCDGFYFPVSFRTGRNRFSSDEQRCNSECYNAPTKLFYYSNPGGSIENMRALDGTRYRDLANAFKYRRKFVADCRCKAAPWSEQARQQHESWALERKSVFVEVDAFRSDEKEKGKGNVTTAATAANSVSRFQY